MKKIIVFTLLALLIISLGVFVIGCLSNPLRRSEERIREDILALTPIGSSMEDVIEVIDSNEWWNWFGNINHYSGFSSADRTTPNARVGEQSIRILLGEYRNIFITSVVAFWGFDEDGYLIDIRIRKDVDTF